MKFHNPANNNYNRTPLTRACSRGGVAQEGTCVAPGDGGARCSSSSESVPTRARFFADSARARNGKVSLCCSVVVVCVCEIERE